jgi:hypothetical protein
MTSTTTKTALRLVAGALAIGCVACQTIAGITDLEVGVQATGGGGTGAAGGAEGGAGGTGGAGGAEGGAGGAGGEGTPCGGATCDSGDFCEPQSTMCVDCGHQPMMQSCMPNDEAMICGGICMGPDCVRDCSGGSCTGTITVGSMTAQAPMVVVSCPDVGDCDDLTVQCAGPSRCSVACGPDACSNLVLKPASPMDPAPLRLSCLAPTSCMGASVECGINECIIEGVGSGNGARVCGNTCSTCP